MNRHAPRSSTRKRKVRGDGDTTSSSSNDDTTATSNNGRGRRAGVVEAKTSSDSKILAGYLAYEFLRKGSINGEKLGSAAKQQEEEERRRLEEVTSILKVDGVHIPGIFNPSQLSRWIRM